MSGTLRSSLLVAFLFHPVGLGAQVLHLRVVQPDSVTPVVGAFVVVSDSAGGPGASGATDAEGRVTLQAPAAGRYLLQIQRVGFAPAQMRGELADGQEVGLVLAPAATPVGAPVIDPAAESACGPAIMSDPNLALVWQQARVGLNLTAMPSFQQLYYLQAKITNQQWNPPEQPQLPPYYSRAYSNPWPIWGPTTKHWTADGFIENRQAFDAEPLWHGPDPAFFLDDAFLGAYCLRLVNSGSVPVLSWLPATDQEGWIGVEYKASTVSSPSGSTVQGILWVDRATFEPRRLDWTYTDLPQWAHGRNAGGRVDLAALPAGGWFAQQWTWRVPRTRMQPFGQFEGYWEYGGEVYQVQSPSREVVVRFGE